MEYEFDELDELSLAYAITIHKAQGSEYPAIIIPITNQHYVLLNRNLIYSAMTREQKLVILIGQHKARQMAINNRRTKHRLTNLVARLKSIKPQSNDTVRYDCRFQFHILFFLLPIK